MRALVSAALLLACGLPAAAEPEFYLGGIQVHELDHDRWVDTLQRVGMNTVAVTVYAKQGDWDTGHLWFEEQEPAVLDEIRTAKANGLAVVLVLRVALDHSFPRNEFLWHGMIMPRSDEELDRWFAGYGEFVRKWAAISEAEGVDVLGIGSEMKWLTATLPLSRYGNMRNYYGFYWYQRFLRKRARRFADELESRKLWIHGSGTYDSLETFLEARFRSNMDWARQAHLRPGGRTLKRVNRRRERISRHWIRLIEATREVYGGKLTYAANFDNYHNVGFWRHLDLMGINSYFSLAASAAESQQTDGRLELFSSRWRRILNEIDRFQRQQGVPDMPYLFTELGYTFLRHSTVEPWNHSGFTVVGWKGEKRKLVVWGEQPVDYEERTEALEALRAVSLDEGHELTGILYWKLSTDRSHEEIEPFVLHIGPDSADPAQETLLGFVPERTQPAGD